MADAYSFHIDGEWRDASPQPIRKSRRIAQAATARAAAAAITIVYRLYGER